MFGIDDALLVVAASLASTVAIELGAEIFAQWLVARYDLVGSGSAPQALAESLCSPAQGTGTFSGLIETASTCNNIGPLMDCAQSCNGLATLVVF